MPGGEKTEKATPKKRRDMREKEGSVLQSKEFTTAVAVLGSFAGLAVLAQFMFQQMMNTVVDMISRVGDDVVFNQEFVMEISIDIIQACVIIIGPIAAVCIFVNILPDIFQTKGLFTMKPLKPKFSKLNPLTGIKRLFSAQAAVGILKSIIELVAIIYVVYIQLMGKLEEIARLIDMDPIQGVAYIAATVFSIVMTIAVIFAFVAVGDYVFQWWQFEKKLKMSKQEVKDEYKQTEGDPQIKGKIKQKQREMAQQRMMEQVPAADVVVRNPTHFAVAIKYDSTIATSAPKVVAKGMDSLALKIIDIATENNVYITENRPLARTLYETVELGREIPPSLYTAVATILSDMYSERGLAANMASNKRPQKPVW